MTKFDDSLLEFMKTHEGTDCLMDIEGTDKWVEVSFEEDVVTNAKKKRYTPKWHICFHDTEYEYRDNDYYEDAFDYLNNHWIPGVSKLKVQTFVEVKLDDSEMPRPSVNIPLDPSMFNRIRNTTMTEEQKVGLEDAIRDYMDKISSPDTKEKDMKIQIEHAVIKSDNPPEVGSEHAIISSDNPPEVGIEYC